MHLEINGLIGLLILVADLYAIISTIRSRSSTGTTVVWLLVILVLPMLGFILWLFFGPKSG